MALDEILRQAPDIIALAKKCGEDAEQDLGLLHIQVMTSSLNESVCAKGGELVHHEDRKNGAGAAVPLGADLSLRAESVWERRVFFRVVRFYVVILELMGKSVCPSPILSRSASSSYMTQVDV